MKRFLVIYALSALLTTTAYADAYQNLLKAYNSRESAENLYGQIGKNLSKRIATEAERSNLSFIAIYGGVAKWDSNGLLDKLLTLTENSSSSINEASPTHDEKQYRINHYVNLVVLCVASYLSSEKQTLANPQDILQAIQGNISQLQALMHSDVLRRLRSLKAGDIQGILNDYNFDESYQLAKEYVKFYESIKENTGKPPRDILYLSRDQAIQYQEALLKINKLNKAYEARKTTVTPAAASPSLKAVFPTAETGDSKVSSEKDDGNRQKSMVLASGESDEIIINGTEGVWRHNEGNGSLSNRRETFSDGEWARAEDGRIIIRGNIHANRGGMILATGKYIPAPPPPAPRAAPPLSAPRALVSPPPPPPPPLPAFSSDAATVSSVAIPSDVAHLSEQHRTLLRARGLLNKDSTNKEERKNLILRLSPVGFRLPDDDSDGESPRNVTIRKKRTQEEIQRDREESEREAMEIEESEMREKIKQEIKKKKYDAAIEELAIIEPQLEKLEGEHKQLLLRIKENKKTLENYQPNLADTGAGAAATDVDDDGFADEQKKDTLTPQQLVELSLQRTDALLIQKREVEDKIDAIEKHIETASTIHGSTEIKLSADEEAELSSYKTKLYLGNNEKEKRDLLANKLAKLKRDADSAYTRNAKELKKQLEDEKNRLNKTDELVNLEEVKRETIAESVHSLDKINARLPVLKSKYDELLRRKGTLDTEAERNKPKEDEIAFRSQTSPLGDLLKGGMGGRRQSMGHGESDSESDDEDNGYESD